MATSSDRNFLSQGVPPTLGKHFCSNGISKLFAPKFFTHSFLEPFFEAIRSMLRKSSFAWSMTFSGTFSIFFGLKFNKLIFERIAFFLSVLVLN